MSSSNLSYNAKSKLLLLLFKVFIVQTICDISYLQTSTLYKEICATIQAGAAGGSVMEVCH